jgi:hypothetical protein
MTAFFGFAMLAFAVGMAFLAFFACAGLTGLVVRAVHVGGLLVTAAGAGGKSQNGNKADGEKRFFHV